MESRRLEIGNFCGIVVHGLIEIPYRPHIQLTAVIHVNIGGIVSGIVVQEKFVYNKIVNKRIHVDICPVLNKVLPVFRIQRTFKSADLFRDVLNALFGNDIFLWIFDVQVSGSELPLGRIVFQHNSIDIVPIPAKKRRSHGSVVRIRRQVNTVLSLLDAF